MKGSLFLLNFCIIVITNPVKSRNLENANAQNLPDNLYNNLANIGREGSSRNLNYDRHYLSPNELVNLDREGKSVDINRFISELNNLLSIQNIGREGPSSNNVLNSENSNLLPNNNNLISNLNIGRERPSSNNVLNTENTNLLPNNNNLISNQNIGREGPSSNSVLNSENSNLLPNTNNILSNQNNGREGYSSDNLLNSQSSYLLPNIDHFLSNQNIERGSSTSNDLLNSKNSTLLLTNDILLSKNVAEEENLNNYNPLPEKNNILRNNLLSKRNSNSLYNYYEYPKNINLFPSNYANINGLKVSLHETVDEKVERYLKKSNHNVDIASLEPNTENRFGFGGIRGGISANFRFRAGIGAKVGAYSG